MLNNAPLPSLLESGPAMNRFETRLSKLEANVPAPASPFDGLTIDELSVFLLEEYSELVAHDDMPEEIRDAKRHIARITGQITETVNFASGRWAMMPGSTIIRSTWLIGGSDGKR